MSVIFDKYTSTRPVGDRQFDKSELKSLSSSNQVQLEIDGKLEDLKFNRVSYDKTLTNAIFEHVTSDIVTDNQPISYNYKITIDISAADRINVIDNTGVSIPLSKMTKPTKNRVFNTSILNKGDIVRFTFIDKTDEYNIISYDDCVGIVEYFAYKIIQIRTIDEEGNMRSVSITPMDLFDQDSEEDDDIKFSIEALDIEKHRYKRNECKYTEHPYTVLLKIDKNKYIGFKNVIINYSENNKLNEFDLLNAYDSAITRVENGISSGCIWDTSRYLFMNMHHEQIKKDIEKFGFEELLHINIGYSNEIIWLVDASEFPYTISVDNLEEARKASIIIETKDNERRRKQT